MRNISKTSYTQFLKCPKMLWYNTHGFERTVSEITQRTLDDGIEFGIMAQSYFGDHVVVDRESKVSMTDQTKAYLENGAENIAEATFAANGGYCQVDILHKNENGHYDIVEVKSSSQVKPYYLDDVAFQYYVVKDCVPIDRCFLLHMNSAYRRHGELTNELFTLEDITESVLALQKSKVKKTKAKSETPVDPDKELIGEAIDRINALIDGEIPDIKVHSGCEDSWECPFMNDCILSLNEKEQGFMLYEDLTWKQRIKCLEKGEMVYPRGKEVLTMGDEETLFNKDGVLAFLKDVKYPLYLLDFESIQNIVPQFDGQKPWQQTPFQYSLHVVDSPDEKPEELVHKEFLWTETGDPREALVKQLITDIPEDACVMAYNMMFEKGILSDLAFVFPEYAGHLMAIHDHCIDLMVPFKNRDYYKGDMRGSYSIKKVLPSCYPDDPALDYHQLDEVQNGTMAQEKYIELIGMDPGEEKEKLKKNMLKYCELDTFAMYKVLQFLYGLCT